MKFEFHIGFYVSKWKIINQMSQRGNHLAITAKMLKIK